MCRLENCDNKPEGKRHYCGELDDKDSCRYAAKAAYSAKYNQNRKSRGKTKKDALKKNGQERTYSRSERAYFSSGFVF